MRQSVSDGQRSATGDHGSVKSGYGAVVVLIDKGP